jgi:hypothetical protein
MSRPREISKLFSTNTNITTDSELASINLNTAIITASAAAVAAANIYTDNATPDLTPAIQSASAAAVAYTNEQISNIDLTPYATTAQLSASVNNIDLTAYATNAQLSASVANIDMGAAIVSASGAAVAELNNRIVISSASPTISNIDGRIWIDISTASAPVLQTYGSNTFKVPKLVKEKAVGGNISYFGNYTIHIFLGTGTFQAFQNLNLEYLIVAGGGGGGQVPGDTYPYEGGGGAGGVLSGSISIDPGSHVVEVGSGGVVRLNGNNSSFISFTTFGGGYGGQGNPSGNYRRGGDGGSGGGGANASPWTGPAQGGNGVAGQGSSGGSGWIGGSAAGNGGGGAGGPGQVTPSGNAAAAGGIGISSQISGTSVTYGTGGYAVNSGGLGGTRNGNAFTGEGGSSLANGGSGIVIIRYLT